MATLALTLPNSLAKASQEAAKRLGVSRTQFICRAIAHELKNFQSRFEEEAMVRSMLAMKKNPAYLEQAQKPEGLSDYSDWFDGKNEW